MNAGINNETNHVNQPGEAPEEDADKRNPRLVHTTVKPRPDEPAYKGGRRQKDGNLHHLLRFNQAGEAAGTFPG